MKNKIKSMVNDRVNSYVGKPKNDRNQLKEEEQLLINRKTDLFKKRNAEIVKCAAKGQIIGQNRIEPEDITKVDYIVHLQFLIRQNEQLYVEEHCEERKAIFQASELIDDYYTLQQKKDHVHKSLDRTIDLDERISFKYDRLAAVRYAETWWNSYNPKFKKFEVDCTNFISQCLYAGKAPMIGYPNRNKGWWMRDNNWSYSWSVAHALRWYLSGAKVGLRGKEVESPKDLLLGDVICYDFQGDGRFDHNTIVVAKDTEDMPLVNAHTYNSRMRYWSYEDSTAYTPDINYKFFRIVDDQ